MRKIWKRSPLCNHIDVRKSQLPSNFYYDGNIVSKMRSMTKSCNKHLLLRHPYSLESTVFAHPEGTVVSVCTCAIPVTRHRLGVKGHNNAKVFRHAMQQEASHPQVVAHLDALTGAHLELPLANMKWIYYYPHKTMGIITHTHMN